MARPGAIVTNAELSVLNHLWEHGPSVVREIASALYSQNTPAYLSFPKTPSVLSCKDLRLLVESATYIKRTDSKDQERTEDGSSSADMST